MEFVDTNVLLYAYDRTDEHRFGPANALVERLGDESAGALSVQVLQEFYVNATRKLHRPMSPADARVALDVYATWTCFSPLAEDVAAAASLSETAQLSFWDAMVVHSARSLGCSLLWTEDLNDGQIIAGVEIRSPFRSA